ncbi:MAG TPA: peptidyl-prolyl cis-trans isomerase [Polyangiaceae bacterium]|nr:peptidyl-prolyl cis-trans isomerase [Polyangiaceae bacterium]
MKTTPQRHVPRPRGLGAAALLAAWLLSLSGCVITTHEGVHEPPRGASKRIWPPLGTPLPETDGPTTTAGAGAETIAARHILVMYRGGMRAPASVTRSKEEARSLADEALARAKAGEDFTELVREYSDEPGAPGRGGSLGKFPRGVMVREFENVAFALDPGEISEVVESPFGYHIIQRTE